MLSLLAFGWGGFYYSRLRSIQKSIPANKEVNKQFRYSKSIVSQKKV
jgi:hypothetical protein